ncbi:MAG TPA: S8 family serine peptidase, partial [Methylomirabilota bacterium]|nr:S8 family serine peptidase [Methylomirabilota bacterium]
MNPSRSPGNLALWLCSACLFLSPSLHSLAQEKSLHLRNELIVTTPSPATPGPQPQAIEPPVSGLYLVQFTHPVRPEWRAQLPEDTVQLLHYIPDDAFIARLDKVSLSQLRALPFIHWVGSYRPAHKLDDRLAARLRQARPAQDLPIQILLAPGATPLDQLRTRQLFARLQRASTSRLGTLLQGTLPPARLAALADSPAVLWIEPAPNPKLFDEIAAKIVGGDDGDSGTPTLTQQFGFDGAGVTVAVPDSGLNLGEAASMHPDLLGRTPAFFHYGALDDASDGHGHGTHVSGIIAGNGATGETDDNGYLYGLGVAPGASIVAQRIFDSAGSYTLLDNDFPRLVRDAMGAGAEIGSNSWGDDTQGRYDLSAAAFDALVRDGDDQTPGDQPFILEFSAGNSGPGQRTIGSPAVAKNVIATGASQNNRFDLYPFFPIYDTGQETMADFSSRGPAEDGRIKPDVVAPGTWIASLQSAAATDQNAWLPISPNYQYQGGTSQAGPQVSGAAAVFLQFYRETVTNQPPSPALVKAALINAAVDMDNSIETAPAPNHDEGWGRVDLTRIIGADRGYLYLDQTERLQTGATYEQRVVVSDSDQPLKITLAYTDVPGLPAAVPALVNDLDLEVTGPDGTLYLGNRFDNGSSIPNALTPDRINNVEAVHLPDPLPGEYIVRVSAFNVPEDAARDTEEIDQDFALVISGALPLPGAGVLVFNRRAYRAPDRMEIRLIDFDLAGDPSASIDLHSTTDPAGFTVTLEAMGNRGVFTGAVDLVTAPSTSDTSLQVAHGDIIEGTYLDTSPEGPRTATAVVDLVPPVFGPVSATNEFAKVILSWDTDEPASGIVRYGIDGNLNQSVTNAAFRASQDVELSGLESGVTYQFLLVATDPAGNSTTNDNNGALFTFVPAPPPDALVIVSEDGFVELPSIVGYTTALDQAGIRYDIWETEVNGSPALHDLIPYAVVIWRLPEFFGTLQITEQEALTEYLDGGGALLIASMEATTRLTENGAEDFIRNVLHVAEYVEDAEVPALEGVEDDPISDGIAVNLDYTQYDFFPGTGFGPDFSDHLTPTQDAVSFLTDPFSSATVGIRYPRTGQDSAGRVVFLSFPLDTIPLSGEPPNNRTAFVEQAIRFLAPGFGGFGTLALDRAAYTLPSTLTAEVADSDLAGQGILTLRAHSDTEPEGREFTLEETPRPGLFRGSINLASTPSQSTANPRRATHGDTVWIQYFDASLDVTNVASAYIDTIPLEISNVSAQPDYVEAVISWQTSEPGDALVQFGESTFLGRTAFRAALSESHALTLTGLQPNRTYYYKVVSRDAAGNATEDINNGQLHTFVTPAPILPPWSDDFESGATNWTVFSSEETEAEWQLGTPANGHESAAHSPQNAWGSNLNGRAIDIAQSFLISPPIALTGGAEATLTFWHSYDFTELGEFDFIQGGTVMVIPIDGAESFPVGQWSIGQVSNGWEQEQINLTPFMGQVIHLVWVYELISLDFLSSFSRAGWLVDDVAVAVSGTAPTAIHITNNLSQATWSLDGPLTESGAGLDTTLTNPPPGEYTVTFHPVPFHIPPEPQTRTLVNGDSILFSGLYAIEDTAGN